MIFKELTLKSRDRLHNKNSELWENKNRKIVLCILSSEEILAVKKREMEKEIPALLTLTFYLGSNADLFLKWDTGLKDELEAIEQMLGT